MNTDKVIYGNIYTVDKKLPKAEAVAIADGKFVYVGDEAGVKAYIGESTEEIRYENGIILPGLGEGHGHIAPGGTEALFTVHLSPFGTLDEHLAAVLAQLRGNCSECMAFRFLSGKAVSAAVCLDAVLGKTDAVGNSRISEALMTQGCNLFSLFIGH